METTNIISYPRHELHTVDLSQRVIKTQVMVPSSRSSVCLRIDPKMYTREEERKGRYRGKGYAQSKNWCSRNTLEVQWLGLGTFTAMAQVQAPVRELKSYKPVVQPKKL